MAFCAKCGGALPSDGPGFCPACGAPVGATSPAAAAPPAAAPSPAPVYTGAAPPRSGNTVLKVILIVIAVVVGLGVLGTAAVGYLGYRAVHNGAISVGNSSVSSSDLGVDPYPNGTPMPHGTVRMNLAGHQMVTATYTTSDSQDTVVSYFKGRLGDSAIVNQSAQGTTLQAVQSGTDNRLIVTVAPDTIGTKIVIVHTTGS